MADPKHDNRPPAGKAAPADTPADVPGRAARGVTTSLAIVVAGLEPRDAAALVAEVQDSVPAGARQEYLVLDDHTNPSRRQLVNALQGVGDAMRLVPRPSGGRATEFDALSLSARSEFLVVALGARPPVGLLASALGLMWSRGSDAVAVVGEGVEPVEGDTGMQLVEYLGMRSLGATAPRVVVVRRWVARWLFSEIDRALDPGDEVADRARLLGLDMAVLTP